MQRIGLSATQRPLDEIGRFLGGVDRPVTLVDVGKRKRLDLEVVVPIEDMANPPAIEEPGVSRGAPCGPGMIVAGAPSALRRAPNNPASPNR